ncbi:MAG: trans-aconitate 2-methyltransferase [Rhizobiaceae bacterium]
MSSADAKAFWKQQTSSLHRSDGDAFYARKAAEHASLLTAQERAAGAVDLGCGAGELLYFLSDEIDVRQGIDYSASMLEQAGSRLDGKGIQLQEADFRVFLPGCSQAVWLTTGALNQYLDASDTGSLLELFQANQHARSFFLFDCIDPIKFLLMPYGIRYQIPLGASAERGLNDRFRSAYHAFRRVGIGAQLAGGFLSRDFATLRGKGMGYGQLPRFWLMAAKRLDLSAEIVSSRYYEYRYHVLLRKRSA